MLPYVYGPETGRGMGDNRNIKYDKYRPPSTDHVSDLLVDLLVEAADILTLTLTRSPKPSLANPNPNPNPNPHSQTLTLTQTLTRKHEP